jgi:hypothetical protein
VPAQNEIGHVFDLLASEVGQFCVVSLVFTDAHDEEKAKFCSG